jgi:flagella basal body P-ring formation protein FlgA
MKAMQSGRKMWTRGMFAALVVFAWAFIQLPARAQAVASEAQLPALAQHWLDQTLVSQSARIGLPVRLHGTLGALDSRLRLAPCARVEAYLPPGSRLWGPGRIGLRCLEGTVRWNVFMPVTVKATGSAWVLRRDVAPGRPLEEADLTMAEVDWAAEPSPVLAGPDEWRDQVANRALASGQTLRQNMVRAAQVFQAGTQVRVLVQGGGFQISSQAQALSPGVVGQLARVRMESGRVLSATVLDARTVRVEM